MHNKGSYWDTMYRNGSHRNFWDYRHPSQELVSYVLRNAPSRDRLVVDLGCGTGEDAIFMAGLGYDVVAIDISQTAIDIASGKAADRGVSVDFRCADILDIPVSDNSVGLVTDRGCFHHVLDEDRHRFSQEIERVLCKGGSLLLRGSAEHKPPFFYKVDEEEVEKYFTQSCFSHSEIVPISLVTDGGILDSNIVSILKT